MLDIQYQLGSAGLDADAAIAGSEVVHKLATVTKGESRDVTSLSQADGYVEIPTGVAVVEAGERVDVTLF